MRTLAALASAALVVIGCAACGSETGAETTVASPKTGGEPTSMRAPAPPIAGRSLDGASLTLADYLGRAVLVNVWSSW
jgi:hypothetical protein